MRYLFLLSQRLVPLDEVLVLQLELVGAPALVVEHPLELGNLLFLQLELRLPRAELLHFLSIDDD